MSSIHTWAEYIVSHCIVLYKEKVFIQISTEYLRSEKTANEPPSVAAQLRDFVFLWPPYEQLSLQPIEIQPEHIENCGINLNFTAFLGTEIYLSGDYMSTVNFDFISFFCGISKVQQDFRISLHMIMT